MTSILTNTAAMAALQTLRAIGNSMESTQAHVALAQASFREAVEIADALILSRSFISAIIHMVLFLELAKLAHTVVAAGLEGK